jgi:hypothetical protein
MTITQLDTSTNRSKQQGRPEQEQGLIESLIWFLEVSNWVI